MAAAPTKVCMHSEMTEACALLRRPMHACLKAGSCCCLYRAKREQVYTQWEPKETAHSAAICSDRGLSETNAAGGS
jgi:hypothetical protein